MQNNERVSILSGMCEIRFELKGVPGTIVRRVRLPSETTLHQLHHVVQSAVGWRNIGAYVFVSKEGVKYTSAPQIYNEQDFAAALTTVDEVFSGMDEPLTYWYWSQDFEWEHHLAMSVAPVDMEIERPLCTKAVGEPVSHEKTDVSSVYDTTASCDDEQQIVDDANEQIRSKWAWTLFSENQSVHYLISKFLMDQKSRLSIRTYRNYSRSIHTLMWAFDGGLVCIDDMEKVHESKLRLADVLDFNELLSSLGMYFDHYLSRKVSASASEVKENGTTVRRLLKWANEREIIDDETQKRCIARLNELIDESARCAKLRDVHYRPPLIPDQPEEEYIETHVEVVDIDNEWIRVRDYLDGRDMGWISMPESHLNLLEEGMCLSAAMVKVEGNWYAADVYNIIP